MTAARQDTTAAGWSFNPSSRHIDATIVEVDAAVATSWLERNVHNRPLRVATTNKYRADMLGGRWAYAGDPIRFDNQGQLIDGQHRLHALSTVAGLSLPFLVVRGLPPGVQLVMDQGTKRTPGDQLALYGVKNSHLIAAIVKQVLIWDAGLMFRDAKLMPAHASTSAIKQWVDEHPDEIALLQELVPMFAQNDAPSSINGAAAVAFGRIDRRKTVEFFTLLATGAGVAGHPIVTLDKRLQRIRRNKLMTSHRDYLALMIAAWNAWRSGRDLSKFQKPRGGVWTEATFPVPH